MWLQWRNVLPMTFEDINDKDLEPDSIKESLQQLEAMESDDDHRMAADSVVPLTAKSSDDYRELLTIMANMMNKKDKENATLYNINAERSRVIDELLLKNAQCKHELTTSKQENANLKQDNQQLQQLNQQLLQANRQLQEAYNDMKQAYNDLKQQHEKLQAAHALPPCQRPPSHPFADAPAAAAAPDYAQASLEVVHEAYTNPQSLSSPLAAQATQLPPQARASSAAPRHRQKDKPLDWDLFDAIVQEDNKMTELNNDRAKVFLEALHLQHIIDERFHMRRNITNNVVCFIEKELHNRIPTTIKWEIFDRLFKRSAVRTYDNKMMKISDRHLCNDIARLFDDVEHELDKQ